MTRAETAAEAASLAEACSASFFAAGTRPGLLLWRIDQKVLVSGSTPGSFYEDAAYIVLLTTQAGPDALSSDIYLWLGAKTKPEDQGVASIMARYPVARGEHVAANVCSCGRMRQNLECRGWVAASVSRRTYAIGGGCVET